MIEQTPDPASVELEKQLARLDAITDPVARAAATDLVASLLEFHGAALERIFAAVEAKCGDTTGLFTELDRDPLVRSLLLLHDLHPSPLRERVESALREVEPRLAKREARAELVTAEDGIVKVRITTSGAPHGPIAPAVEQAIRAAAPDAEQVVVEETGPAPSTFVPLQSLRQTNVTEAAAASEK